MPSPSQPSQPQPAEADHFSESVTASIDHMPVRTTFAATVPTANLSVLASPRGEHSEHRDERDHLPHLIRAAQIPRLPQASSSDPSRAVTGTKPPMSRRQRRRQGGLRATKVAALLGYCQAATDRRARVTQTPTQPRLRSLNKHEGASRVCKQHGRGDHMNDTQTRPTRRAAHDQPSQAMGFRPPARAAVHDHCGGRVRLERLDARSHLRTADRAATRLSHRPATSSPSPNPATVDLLDVTARQASRASFADLSGR
jgi:hypothetical protein